MVWSQGSAGYTASRSTIAEDVVQGFRSSSVSVTHKGYLIKSRRPLRFGSSQANRSAFNTEPALRLAAVSRSHVNNQPPSW